MHVQDPRDFYASESPVLADFDSDQELYKSAEEIEVSNDTEGQNELQGSSFAARPVRFSCLIVHFIINSYETVASVRHSALATLAAFVTPEC